MTATRQALPESSPAPAAPADARAGLEAAFQRQREDFLRQPFPDLRARLADLERLRGALRTHADALVEAISADFGHRCGFETRGAELMVAFQTIAYVKRRLKRWMRPSRRAPGLLFASTRAWVEYQPLGVVGVLAPWNYPLQLAVVPLVYALAAGNRVMIKPSELTPRCAGVIAEMLGGAFAPERVSVVQGGAEVAQAFSALPFDHLFFTGSTAVGRKVMRAAAEHLTPVTLELGGKSPAIVSASAALDEAAARLCFGKVMNAGQTCVAPDYVLCPAERVDALVEALGASFQRMFPVLAGNADYTSIHSEAHYARLQAMLDEARAGGARLVPLGGDGAGEAARLRAERRMPVTVVLDPPAGSRLLEEEIFGPPLPVIACRDFDEMLRWVAARPRPLALNYFGRDATEQQRLLRELHAGSVCLNDAVFQVAVEDLPFGGVGESGMGRYHGEEGFRTFSHAKSVFARPRLNTAKVFYPPYGKALQRLVLRLFSR